MGFWRPAAIVRLRNDLEHSPNAMRAAEVRRAIETILAIANQSSQGLFPVAGTSETMQHGLFPTVRRRLQYKHAAASEAKITAGTSALGCCAIQFAGWPKQ